MQTIPLEMMRIPDGFYVYKSSLYRNYEDLSWASSHSMEMSVQKYRLVLYHYESQRCFNIRFKRIDNEKLDLVNKLEVFQEEAEHQKKKMNIILRKNMKKFHEEMKLRYNLK